MNRTGASFQTSQDDETTCYGPGTLSALPQTLGTCLGPSGPFAYLNSMQWLYGGGSDGLLLRMSLLP